MSDNPTATKRATASPAAADEAGPDPRRWWALLVVLTATFLALFDLFVVNVAAPSIQAELHTTTAALQLVIAGYSFTYALGLITGGRLGDLLGPRLMFLVGMAVFGLALVACGTASNATVLVTARLGQGAGASLMVPQVLALIQVLIPPAERPRAFAYFGAVAGLGAVAGQAVGGLLLSANLFGLHWRAIFLIQLPLAAASLAAGWTLLPSAAHAGAASTRRFDVGGALLFALALAGLLVPLTLGRQNGWPAWSIAALAAVLPLSALFALQQRARVARGAVPLIAPRLFADRSFDYGLLINLAFYCDLGSFFLVVAWYLQDGAGMSALRAGLTFSSLGVGFIIGSFFIARRLAAKYARQLLAGGVILVVLALVGAVVQVAEMGVRVGSWQIAPVMFFVGLGNGLVLPTVLNVVLAGVAKDLAGAASGVLVTMQQVGTAVGVAAIGALFFGMLGAGPDATRFRHATVVALAADAALVALTGLCIAALLRSRRRAAAGP
ncbi:MAG TPA: MFS transporter [Actinocrinis sp.]